MKTTKKMIAPQLDFFKLPAEEGDQYSQSIDFYDALPKYDWRHKREYEINEDNSVLEREFVYKKEKFFCRVTPAVIEKNGKRVYVYPSRREELVEDAMRKLAVEGAVEKFNDDDIGIRFTIHGLQDELAKQGHNFDKNTIKESCLVMSKSNIDCIDAKGTGLISGNFLSGLGLTTSDDWEKYGKAKRCYAQFNHLVSGAIRSGRVRLYNYQKAMQLSDSLSRYLFKRMSANFLQASYADQYTIGLKTVFRDSGRTLSPKMGNNIRTMVKALECLQDEGHIYGYEKKTHKTGIKIEDIIYTLYPTENFIKDTVIANAVAKNNPALA